MSDDERIESVRTVADALGLEHVQAVLAEVDSLRVLVERLRAALAEYAEHNSWRCQHPPHWYLVDPSVVPEGDCPCGLLSTLDEFGISHE